MPDDELTIETVDADWVADSTFVLRDRFGYEIVMTQPAGVNGADLLPLSVIGCAAWDIAAILLKQRQPLEAFGASAESRRESSAPWRFRSMHIRYDLTGDLNPVMVQRAISLTQDKYCATYATLGPAVEITSEFNIHAPGSAGPAAELPAALVRRFNQALNAGDLEAMHACLSADTVFESTWPAPNGTRYEGVEAVMGFWREFFRASRQPRIDMEEFIVLPGAGESRVTMLWTYHWLEGDGAAGHVRGVDVYRVRDGLIAEKLSYVKG
jgi:uncharacterized OsmC-like protein/ketosteroid isomerase-like protein